MIYEDKNLHSLITLEEFKAIMGIDAREDKTARFCVLTATLTIEQYCQRQLLRKKYFETIPFGNSLVVPFREYPVVEIIQVKSEMLEVRNVFVSYLCMKLERLDCGQGHFSFFTSHFSFVWFSPLPP